MRRSRSLVQTKRRTTSTDAGEAIVASPIALGVRAMPAYDDNFGWYEGFDDDPDARAFYHQVQRESVWKKCKRCHRKVKLRRDYVICNSCADALERGGDY